MTFGWPGGTPPQTDKPKEKRCPICATMHELGNRLKDEVAGIFVPSDTPPKRSLTFEGNIERALCLAFERGASLDEPDQWMPCDEHIRVLEPLRKVGF